MISDEELYARIQDGDLTAFDLLYERYQIRLFRFIYSYVKNQAEAEDLFHEAFIKVLREKNLDFGQSKFQSWIFQVSRNACLNHLRSQNRTEKKLTIAHEWVPRTNLATAETLLTARDTDLKIANVVQQLPSEQQEVFHLKLLGMAEKEIAKVLQIPAGTVKSRFHKIIEFIKQEVRE